MILAALTPLRNEAWVAAYSLRTMLGWVDHLCLLLHRCEDDTQAIVDEVAAEHPGRVHVISEDGEAFDEVLFRGRLMALARKLGATRFAPVDADEVLAAPLLGTIRAKVAALRPGEVLQCPWVRLWGSLDAMDAGPALTVPLAFAGAPGVAYKPGADGYTLHMRNPRGTLWLPSRHKVDPGGRGGLLHLQQVDRSRMLARAAWRKADELLRWPHHRGGVDGIEHKYAKVVAEPSELAPVPARWWENGVDRSLIDLEAVPWEAADLRRLVELHGRGRFAGLDLYGVA